MNNQIMAVLITQGTELISDLLRTRALKMKLPQLMPDYSFPELEPETETLRMSTPIEPINETPETPNKATEIATGCLPCALGHLGTCTGLLNESMRFAYKNGLASPETIDRVNMCLDELNAMERVDLRPEMIAQLPEWEKKLANKALLASRDIRHKIEGLASVETLEELAANTQTVRTEIGRSWFQEKMKKLSPEDKAEIQQRVLARMETLDEE